MNLREVQDYQAAYDSEYWAHGPGEATICHSERQSESSWERSLP